MDSPAGFFLYVAVKLFAYSGWCYLGLRWLGHRNSLRVSLGFGLARLCLGVFFGIAIFVIGAVLHLGVPAHPVAMYLSIYAPVRYVEWTILALFLQCFAVAVEVRSLRTQTWILGGIVVSHLADLPMILNSYEGTKEFLPVGRFLC